MSLKHVEKKRYRDIPSELLSALASPIRTTSPNAFTLLRGERRENKGAAGIKPNHALQGANVNVGVRSKALGHVTSVTAYNAHGQPLTIVDPNGLTTASAARSLRRATMR